MIDPADAPVPTAHVDDERSTSVLAGVLTESHGQDYEFAIDSWEPGSVLEPPAARVDYYVVIAANGSSVTVRPGDQVRGRPPAGTAPGVDGRGAAPPRSLDVELWPADVVIVGPGDDPVELTGNGTYLRVRTEETAYPTPRFCFVRHIQDDPAGCAEYEDAFRREVLPPVVSDDGGRGVNRVNQHTIDMRYDREPRPVQHCHAPVATGDGELVPHTETAIVLDRPTYGLPPVDGTDQHIRLFRRPHEDASDRVDLTVEPGSIVVTPATAGQVYGHCFRNTFAALVAVPGFTAPLIELGADTERAGDTHRKYHQSGQRGQ